MEWVVHLEEGLEVVVEEVVEQEQEQEVVVVVVVLLVDYHQGSLSNRHT